MRSFRLFRIFKLAREWVSMRIILHKIMLTVIEVANFAVLLFLFMYIYALMGMQFFANRFKFDEDGYAIPIGSPHPQSGVDWHKIPSSRANFDDFHFSIIAVFQILSGENWNVVMYDGWRSTDAFAAIYFMSLIMFGMFIVMTLFLAILLNNFGSDDDEEEDLEDDEDIKAAVESEVSKKGTERGGKGSAVTPVGGGNDEKNGPSESVPKRRESVTTQAARFTRNLTLNLGQMLESPDPTSAAKQMARQATPKKKRKRVKEGVLEKSYYPLVENSLYIFGRENKFRVEVAKIVANPKFDQVVLVLIVVSSIMLAIDDPLGDPDSTKATVLGAIDKVFTALFILEMMLKMFKIKKPKGDKRQTAGQVPTETKKEGGTGEVRLPGAVP